MIAALAGYYPVTNWWGRREFEKAEAEVRARGFPVRERVIQVGELDGCFYTHAAFLAEAALPEADQLGNHSEMLNAAHYRSRILDELPGSTRMTVEEARAGRQLLAPFAARRAALIAAVRDAKPLACAPADACLVLRGEDASLAFRLARFLAEDAALAKASGDFAAAFESFEACFTIIGELMGPRFQHTGPSGSPRWILPQGVGRIIEDCLLNRGCAGYDEAQLAEIESLLATIDFPAEVANFLREIPGECIAIHGLRVAGKLHQRRLGPAVIFAGWKWEWPQIQRRAGEVWDSWKPSGLHEAEMAGRLRELADAVAVPRPETYRQLDTNATSWVDFMKGAGSPLPSTRYQEYMFDFMGWSPETEQCVVILARYLVAIERHRLRHSALPLRLEELDPQFGTGLPRYPLNGQQPGYAIGHWGGFQLGSYPPHADGDPSLWEFPDSP